MAIFVPTRSREKTVRLNRRAQAFVTALVLATSLSACASGSEGSAPDTVSEDTVSTASAPPEADQPQTIPAPSVLPGDEWTVAGDLCNLISGETAAGILGHDGTLTTEYDPDELSAAGIDSCRYTDFNAGGLTVLVAVRGEVTDDVWARTEGEFEDQKDLYELTEYGADGVDILANSSQQVIVRRGQTMVSALNSSGKKFDQARLVELAVLVAYMNMG
jgi:hypothetical protein